ncbi:FAD-dependent oxidoreductase, partial [Marinomonas arenicola]|uniref:FAD-dependent oxidoreductase n=1 Tax=Marinomonas arenicola TaxID=569601 RepID=UPI00311FB1F9
VDDARLVVINALSAQQNGAAIFARTRCTSAKRSNGQWHITLEAQLTKESQEITATALVNAAGPWVSSFINSQIEQKPPYGLRMIKGRHIVVPR